MNKNYLMSILYEMYIECTKSIEKIDYNNEDFVCSCCLEIKTSLLRILELQEFIEEEIL